MANAGSGVCSTEPKSGAPGGTTTGAGTELDVATLAPGDVVRIRTRNSGYVIRVVDARAGHAMIEGGAVFATPAMVEVVGAGAGSNCPMGGRFIRVGQALLLLHRGSWVRTGTVRSLGLERAVASEVRQALASLC